MTTEYTAIIIVVAVIAGMALAIAVKVLYDKWSQTSEAKEVRNDVSEFLEKMFPDLAANAEKDGKRQSNDVLSMMQRNVSELREFYIIAKRQARQTFSAAFIACILGFVLYAAGIVMYYYEYKTMGTSALAYAAIGGSVVEVISGLFFWLYSKATEQLNIYHASLLETQKQLSALQVVGKLDKTNRDSAYAYIITKTMHKEQNANIVIKEPAAQEQTKS